MERIVAAVDGSAPSLKAVDFAADLASKYNAELILFAVPREFSPGMDADLEAYARSEHIEALASEIGLAAAEAVLAGARLAAEAKGATRIATKWAFGDPAEEIIAFVNEQKAELIVMGSRGYGRLTGLLIGSVAQKVLGHASCPVVVVR
jgi:nucleotide-binding universal stress UspA family protein